MLLVNHLRRIRSIPTSGEAQYRSLLLDLKNLERVMLIRLLPQHFKDTVKIYPRAQADKDSCLDFNTSKDNLLRWLKEIKQVTPTNNLLKFDEIRNCKMI